MEATTRESTIPPPPVAAFEVYRLRVIGMIGIGGATTVNTLYYEGSLPVGSATLNSQIELISLFTEPDGPFSAYVAAVSSAWFLSSITVDVPTSPALATYVHTIGSVTGTAPTPAMPNQMGVTIRKVTNWKGRRGRGRITVPAVPILWVTGTVLNTTLAYNTLVAELGASLDGTNQEYRPTIFSADKKTPYTLRSLQISRFLLNPVLGTARRRKPGVGK